MYILGSTCSYNYGKIQAITASEMRDWLPFLSSFFDMKAKPPAHSVNQYVWPPYDIGNGFGATVPEIFQYLKCFGTFFKSDYLYEQPLLGNNFTPFSMEQFHALRTTAPERIFIDTYRILEAEKAIPIIKTKHPAVGGLFSNYDNFVRYNYNRSLSPIKPVDTSGKSHCPDHMVYIVGYGFDKGKRIGDQDEDDDDMDIGDEDEGTECFLIKNTWKSWGYEGYGMVPVKLFEHVAYPKGVNVRDSSTIINNDFHVAEAQRKYYGRF
nr:PREDICTED: uncharacterized protein LOC108197610 isoform X2 [Daucus carota subsp. sativus]